MGKKRILVLSADAGFGHRSASKAIVAAIERRHGDDCEAILANPLDGARTPPWLRDIQSDYDRIARNLPQLWKLGYDLSDSKAPALLMENALRALLYFSLRDVYRAAEPDLVISTYPLYQAPLSAVFALDRKAVPLVCVVTDLVTVHASWFSQDADLTIVPTEVVRDLALAAGLSADRVEVIGIPVNPAISEPAGSKDELRARLGWDPALPAFLAVGSKRVGGLLEALRAINHSGLPLQLAVAAGGDEALRARLAAETWHLPAKVYGFVEDMPSFLRASDAVISKAGGLIVTESLAAGLPLLFVDALPGQEIGNADYVVRGGAGELVADPLGCLEAVCHWLAGGGSLLRERAEAARRLGKPGAAFEIVDRALGLSATAPRRRILAPVHDRVAELFARLGIRWED